jgi:hypothetical protein
MQPGSLRLRLVEAELVQLLQGQSLHLELGHGKATLFALEVRLRGASHANGAGFELDLHRNTDALQWRLMLPPSAVADYAGTLPRRDALMLAPAPQCGEAGRPLTLLFEIDVRDSVRIRRQVRETGPND